MFNGRKNRLRKELPCCPWRLREVLPLAEGFCRAQLGKAFWVCFILSAHLCEAKHLHVLWHEAARGLPQPCDHSCAQQCWSLSGNSPKESLRCPMGSLLGSPGGRWSVVMLPRATLARRLVLLSEKSCLVLSRSLWLDLVHPI